MNLNSSMFYTVKKVPHIKTLRNINAVRFSSDGEYPQYHSDEESLQYAFDYGRAPKTTWCGKYNHFAYKHEFDYCGSALDYIHLPSSEFFRTPTHITDDTVSMIYYMLSLEIEVVTFPSSGSKRSFGREFQVSFENHIRMAKLLPRYDSYMPSSARASTTSVDHLRTLVQLVNCEQVDSSYTCVGSDFDDCNCTNLFTAARTEQMSACFINAKLAKMFFCNCQEGYLTEPQLVY